MAELLFRVAIYLMTPIILSGCDFGGDENKDNGEPNTLQEMAALVREVEYTEGTFRGLRNGMPKNDVLGQLSRLGVQSVHPDIGVRITVTRGVELDSLRNASGLIIGAGSAIIEFDSDSVTSVHVAPIYPDWRRQLYAAKTRDEVFNALKAILLEGNGDIVVREIAPDAEWITMGKFDQDDIDALAKFDLWIAPFDDDEGHWNLRLYFSEGFLQRLVVWHSPVELP